MGLPTSRDQPTSRLAGVSIEGTSTAGGVSSGRGCQLRPAAAASMASLASRSACLFRSRGTHV